jgi:Fe-S cluster assembly ATP-binding protein
MLSIKQLHVSIEDAKQNKKPVLRGLDLNIIKGEVHAIMGPNGSGKSTLANVLVGREEYSVTQGSIIFQGEDCLGLSPEARAAKGLFLSFQYPTEIPGVNNAYFMRTALNSLRAQRGLPPIDAADFLMLVKQKLKSVGLPDTFLQRGVNEGFSGGEKKRNEILQMLLFEPSLIILDEIDSGLDIDALQMVANSVNSLRDGSRSFLIITHYQRLLDYIKPDVVHVLANGAIVKSGDRTLVHALEEKGYAWLADEAAT